MLVIELDQLQLPYRLATLLQLAVAINLQVATGQAQFATQAGNGVAATGNQTPARVQMQRALARIGDAIVGRHFQKTLALDRNIEWCRCRAHGAHSGVNDERTSTHCIGMGRCITGTCDIEMRIKRAIDVNLALEAGRHHIGQILTDRFELRHVVLHA